VVDGVARRSALLAAGGGAAALLLAQLVPFGRDHDNPPVRAEPAWADAQTRALAVRACFACHSNETRWPWYSQVAPASWLVQLDVARGRAELNFSEWDRRQRRADDAPDEVEDGTMPPLRYTLAHAEARLSAAERELLIQGLEATVEGAEEAAEAAEAAQEVAEEAAEEAEEREDDGGGQRRRRRGRGPG
jgi:hypothetical protein